MDAVVAIDDGIPQRAHINDLMSCTNIHTIHFSSIHTDYIKHPLIQHSRGIVRYGMPFQAQKPSFVTTYNHQMYFHMD